MGRDVKHEQASLLGRAHMSSVEPASGLKTCVWSLLCHNPRAMVGRVLDDQCVFGTKIKQSKT